MKKVQIGEMGTMEKEIIEWFSENGIEYEKFAKLSKALTILCFYVRDFGKSDECLKTLTSYIKNCLEILKKKNIYSHVFFDEKGEMHIILTFVDFDKNKKSYIMLDMGKIPKEIWE